MVLLPRPPSGQDQFGIERIQPSMAGAQTLREIITDFFGWKIKRYILGQILTSESKATGLGSGVAKLHHGTWMDIVRYDAQKLSETLTHQLVQPLLAFNFPQAADLHVRFVIDTESPVQLKLTQAGSVTTEFPATPSSMAVCAPSSLGWSRSIPSAQA